MRRLGLLLLLCVSATACGGVAASPSAAPLKLTIVTLGGEDLDTASAAAPTTLDVRVEADRPLQASDVGVTLDRSAVAVTVAADGSAHGSVAPMALASQHHLTITVDGETRFDNSITVVGPEEVMAAVHNDSGHVALDLDFLVAPDRSAAAALVPGATVRWVDPSHLQAIWDHGAAPAAITVPATLAVAKGSRLLQSVPVDLSPLPPGTLRRQTAPAPIGKFTGAVMAYSVGTAASTASVTGHVGRLAELAPVGWQADAAGGISGSPPAAQVSAAEKAGVAVYPVLANDAAGADATHSLLASSPAESALVSNAESAATTVGAAGVQLDFESIDPADRDRLTSLVTSMATELHRHGLKLVVDVVPDKPGHLNVYSAAYDIPAIGHAADAVVLLAYDESTESTGPGPVAGLSWDEQLLHGSSSSVDPSKVWLGLPLYARSWSDAGASADSYGAAVSAAIAVPGATVGYDFGAETPFIVDTPPGSTATTTYFDDAESLAYKMALATEHHFAGVAVWRLGFEDPAWWATLS